MAGKKKNDPLPLNIAYSLDWRGDLDECGFCKEDVPVFCFIGATEEALVNVFRWITSGGHVARGFRLGHEHACAMRNGHAFWRITITLTDYHSDFIAIDQLRTLIESRLRAEGHKATYFAYDKFINI